MADLIQLEEAGSGIAILRLNDPETRNAMSEKMAEEFHYHTSQLRLREGLRVVIITGQGKAFSGGGHLQMLLNKTKLSELENRRLMEDFYRAFLSVRDLDVPTIAAINGHAIGAGLAFSLACDFRIACDVAKFGLNFVQIGLHPGMGSTYFLKQIVGPAHAAELLLTGKIINAAEAHEIGLVNSIHSEEAFWPAVISRAEQIAANGQEVTRQLKESLRLTCDASLAECLRREAACQGVNYGSEEFLERITAALEKRIQKENA
jgi:enoyl-CoA hydratase/carnithine racemase